MRHRTAPAVALTIAFALGLAALGPAATAPAEAAEPSYALHTAQPTSQPDGLDDPAKKEIAMEIVSSNENSSLDWRAQYKYIEDIHDGRGYTAGIIGFCSGTGDMLEVVRAYVKARPHAALRRFLPALRRGDRTASHPRAGPPVGRGGGRAGQ